MYQRNLESLGKWGDAYAAMMVSVALIVVVVMISSMLYNIGEYFVTMMTFTMFVMSFFGSYIIYKTAPFEIRPFKFRLGPKERQRAIFLFLAVFPAGLLGAVFMMATSGLGMAILVVGISLLPAGIFAYMDDNKVSKLDAELDKFIRSLGNVSGALGTTLTNAMYKLDRRSMGALEPYIRRLQSRLRSQLTPKFCWDRFIDETGSELVHRSTTMFVDGTSMGGSPERVGRIASDYALNMALLRAKRHVTALPFAYLTIPLHGAMTALLIFVLGIMNSFNDKLLEARLELSADAIVQLPTLPVFQTKDLTQTTVLTLGAVIVLTIANTIAPMGATGGHPIKLAFFGSIMCILSGLNLLLIPAVSHSLLAR